MKALIIVDVQYDFLPGGALPVPDGDEIFWPIFQAAKDVDLIVATQDWHPPNHCSFEENGGAWPPHCVQGTRGANLHFFIQRMIDNSNGRTIKKGEHPGFEQYSAFEGTYLTLMLRNEGYDELLFAGLATEYCVVESMRDAFKAGFKVKLVENGTKGIDPAKVAVAKADIRAMERLSLR